MSPKEIVKSFYKSDALINPDIVKSYIHPKIIIEWNSSNGFMKMDFDKIVESISDISIAYIRTKAKISHILQEGELVSVRYSHFVKTVENPREDILLGHFIAIWEIKEDKLYKGFVISQPPS
jgi:hypothetical protein